jgi:RHS repeat-associated protein
VDGVLTEYYLDGYKVLLEKTGSNTIRYTYDIDGTLISFNYNGTEYYYVTNIFGDITHIIDSAGSLMVEYQYDAYGNTIYEYDSGLGLSEINPYRYRGFRYDNDIGLYYLQSRYYNPETGRFINADGIVQSSDTILGLNMYSYAENNPVMNMDPTGYNCVYQDVDGDGDFFDQDGGPCGGGGNYWNSRGTYTSWTSGAPYGSSGVRGGYSSYSYNDVYSTGINSGMGNMISSHGPASSWMNGVYSYGNEYPVGQPVLKPASSYNARTEPSNLIEKFHMEQVKRDPFNKYNDIEKLDIDLTDNRWRGVNGWNKYQSVFRSETGYVSVIHFNYNHITDMYGDFKFTR